MTRINLSASPDYSSAPRPRSSADPRPRSRDATAPPAPALHRRRGRALARPRRPGTRLPGPVNRPGLAAKAWGQLDETTYGLNFLAGELVAPARPGERRCTRRPGN